MTALSLVLVNSQPFLRQPVSRWISTVVRQARLPRRQARVGIPAGETQVPWACFIRGPRAGISTERVLRDAPLRARSRPAPLQDQVWTVRGRLMGTGN